jgi:predicted ATPase/DNA-binding SARP family transcriptional activator
MISSLDNREEVGIRCATAAGSALPVQLTRFVGRRAELMQASALLADARMLTLTGPGGSGKTRLALEIARGVEVRGETLWWVELASLGDASQVAHDVAAALRLFEEAGRSPTRALSESIGERPAVLVLDNCEHVIDGCAQLSDELLRRCPRLRILATSREPLGVPGEIAWPVPPLSLPRASHLPAADAVAQSEAVVLFAERAREVAPAFVVSASNAEAVAGICSRLDGIPLAIELAAARVNVLTPWQILERLDNCFSLLVQRGRGTLPRHQTMRAAIDWSYHLLLPEKRLLLQRLSVFCGGFTLEVAEQVCAGDGIDSSDVLDLVAGLVERSLVTMREHGDSARYHLLEVVRQYAAEHLGGAAAAVLARQHAHYFADFAEAAGPAVDIHQDAAVMARVAAEHDNLRSALECALQSDDSLLALRISGGLWPWCLHSMHWSDGLAWMNKVLEQADRENASAALGRALIGAGLLAYAIQDLARAEALMQAAERVWAQRSDPRYLALVHENLGQLAIHLGDPDAALAHAESSVHHARLSGDAYVQAFVLSTALGFVHAFRGEPERADGYCAEAQRLAHEHHYPFGVLVASFSRAMTALMSGDLKSAARHVLPAVLAMRAVDNPWFVPRLLFVSAAVAADSGDLTRAARLLGASEAMQIAARGGRLLGVEQPYFDRVAASVRAALAAEAFAAAWQAGGGLGLERALDECEAASLDAAARNETTRPAPMPSAPSRMAGGQADRGVSIAAQPPAAGAEALPAPGSADLRVSALGPLEIYRGDELLSVDRWSYAKPRELLLYLLCNPAGATKEQIGAAIWPNGTSAQVRNNLHVTLHYVRKALGSSDWIVYADDRYQISRTRTVSFDLDTFEEAADTIIGNPEAADDAGIDDVLALYRGDFLGSESCSAWHYEWRDRALARYIELLSIRADRAFRRSDHAEALRLYQILVAREELREDLQRRLMQCLARMGERTRALRHGDRLVALLQEELGADPDPETLELCERLRRAETV